MPIVLISSWRCAVNCFLNGSEELGAHCQLKYLRVEVLFLLIQSPSRQHIVFLAFVLWLRTLWRSSASSFSVRKVASQQRTCYEALNDIIAQDLESTPHRDAKR